MGPPVVLSGAMNLFEPPAQWYCILAVVMSVYQGVRGFIFQNQFSLHQARQNQATLDQAKKPPALCAHSHIQRWIIRGVNDAWRYFVSTLAGFAALLFAYRILDSEALASASAGVVTLLVFLVMFGFLGVTGLLPDFLAKLDKFNT
jgi:hypothetical protein